VVHKLTGVTLSFGPGPYYSVFCSSQFPGLLIVIYEPSAGRRCSRMSAFFKARATKERVPLINARMNGRCLHASGSYNIFCTKIKLKFFVSIH
jgi:hypothetical protein